MILKHPTIPPEELERLRNFSATITKAYLPNKPLIKMRLLTFGTLEEVTPIYEQVKQMQSELPLPKHSENHATRPFKYSLQRFRHKPKYQERYGYLSDVYGLYVCMKY